MQTQNPRQQQRNMKRHFRCLLPEEEGKGAVFSSPDDAAQTLLSLSTSSPKQAGEAPPKTRTKRAFEDTVVVAKTITARRHEPGNQRNKRARVFKREEDISSRSRGGTPTLISDDELDDEVDVRPMVVASKRKMVFPTAARKPTDPSDWRSITRPLGLPPRLPRLPAGMTFPKPTYLK